MEINWYGWVAKLLFPEAAWNRLSHRQKAAFPRQISFPHKEPKKRVELTFTKTSGTFTKDKGKTLAYR